MQKVYTSIELGLYFGNHVTYQAFPGWFKVLDGVIDQQMYKTKSALLGDNLTQQD